ncbi:MAG: cohesin domain-containing protein [Pyrinomonadaceae bacterium]
MADYVDAGGVVVQSGVTFYSQGDPRSITGRWLTGSYSPYNYSNTVVQNAPFTLGTFNAGHPLMAGVSSLNASVQNVVAPAAAATQVAASSNGNSLIAYRPISGGRPTVGVTAYLGDFGGSVTGQWGRVIVNAGKWLLPCGPVIAGRVTYQNAAAPVVPVPLVNLTAAGSPAVMAATDPAGNYTIMGPGPGAYTVTPSKAPQPSTTSNGIFSNDAALIARHVVGLSNLNATQQNAAMVGGQGFISSLDAGFVAQYIVGIPNALNQTGRWKFTPTSRTYPAVTASQVNQDYEALLMGDVSGDWSPPAADMFKVHARPMPWDAVTASLSGIKAPFGKEAVVSLSLDGLAGEAVSSYQFTINYDPAVIEPARIAAALTGTRAEGMNIACYSPSPGTLKVAVYSAFPVTGDGVYAALKFNVIGRPGSTTRLDISEFRFNDGTMPVLNTPGSIAVY